LAYVFREDGIFINAELIRQGYAFYLHRQPNTRCDSILLSAQRDAMSQKEGIWSNWKENKATYIGNRRSRRFHLPTCDLQSK
jgi:micrococcal nuclease